MLERWTFLLWLKTNEGRQVEVLANGARIAQRVARLHHFVEPPEFIHGQPNKGGFCPPIESVQLLSVG